MTDESAQRSANQPSASDRREKDRGGTLKRSRDDTSAQRPVETLRDDTLSRKDESDLRVMIGGLLNVDG